MIEQRQDHWFGPAEGCGMLLVILPVTLNTAIMKQRIIQLSIVAALAFAFTGCEPGGVIVSTRPEPPYYERPVSPAPGYVWIDGEWYWSNGRYVYHNGYWGRPRGHRVWIAGNWEQRDNGWKWRRGYWR